MRLFDHHIHSRRSDGTVSLEDRAKTAALPAIWTDRAGFETAAANLGVQADKLVQVIKAGDKAAVATQFGATSASCGACHRNFRART